MSRYTDEAGYNVGVQFPTTRPGLNPQQVGQVRGALTVAPTREVTYNPPVATTFNDFLLFEGDFHRFTLGVGAVTITGFTGARAGLQVIVNADPSNNLTLTNNSVSSDAPNRILSHTGANIILNPNESVLIRYDFTSLRWRTIGFT